MFNPQSYWIGKSVLGLQTRTYKRRPPEEVRSMWRFRTSTATSFFYKSYTNTAMTDSSSSVRKSGPSLRNLTHSFWTGLTKWNKRGNTTRRGWAVSIGSSQYCAFKGTFHHFARFFVQTEKAGSTRMTILKNSWLQIIIHIQDILDNSSAWEYWDRKMATDRKPLISNMRFI